MQRIVLILAALVFSFASIAPAQLTTEVQLDLAAGFNMDLWCGPLELQAVYDYAATHSTDLDLAELQGGMNEGVGFGALWGAMLIGASLDEPYSIASNWFHPQWIADGEGTPADGVLSGSDGTVYHIASAGGNATCPGDMLEVADPAAAWAAVPNGMVAGASHRIEDWSVASVTAELPAAQKARYAEINFVLAARDVADRARNMRIVALYGLDGSDTEVIYAFSSADGGSGPVVTDTTIEAGFESVCAFTKAYRKDNGPTGAVASYPGRLYAFAAPLALDSEKTLWGLRIEDAQPTLQNNNRGLVVLAATGQRIFDGGNLPPNANAGADQAHSDNDGDGVEAVTLDGLASSDADGTIVSYAWSENGQPLGSGAVLGLSLGLGEHHITLAVTDDGGASDTDELVVTVSNPLGFNTYYVDYEGGSDGDSGRSPLAPWKHCPGDPDAAGIPATTALYYGDEVIFKGGVVYRGRIACNRSGEPGYPIIFDGNTADGFGEGRAILDGAETITDWAACADASEAGGNPNWAHIHRAWVPADVTAFSEIFFQDGQLLHPAQDPNIADAFYHDNTAEYLSFDDHAADRVIDADYFTQTDPNAWSGSTYIYLHVGNNAIVRRAVTGYDPATHAILYEPLDTNYYGTYAMVNALRILDAPGEYVVREDQTDALGRRRIYLWPLDDTAPAELVSLSRQPWCFHFGSSSYVTLRGFVIRHSGADDTAVLNNLDADVAGLVVEDNVVINHASGGVSLDEVDAALIVDNRVELCKGRGILLSEATNSTVQGNTLRKNGGTAIDFYWSSDSAILGNTVLDNEGGHANGITVYLDSSDILIAYNIVRGGNVACTMRDSTNVTVAYNILDGNGGYYALADWTSMNGMFLYNNLLINGGLAVSASSTNVVSRNNIMTGSPVAYRGGVSEYNAYLSLSWTQDPETLCLGEFEATAAELFVNAAADDFHPRSDSPAINAGVAIAGLPLTQDLAGNAIGLGGGVDIGPYEYVPTALAGDADGDGRVGVADFIILKRNYNTTSGATVAEGDFNADGAVDVADFIILKQNYNK